MTHTEHPPHQRRLGISIAMCTYNGAAYLQQQLDSIAAQTLLPQELVVCDDGSTDNTLSILEHFASRTAFATRIIRNPVNLGYSRNFAQAAQLCTGDVIALCDQDDIWYPQKLIRIEAIMRLNPHIGGVFSDGHLLNSGDRIESRTLWESFLFNSEEQHRLASGSAIDVLLRRNVVTGMAFAFRSSFKLLLLATQASWIHDGWLAFLIALQSQLFADSEPLVAYRVHGNQQVGAPLSPRGKLRRILKNGLGTYLGEVRDRNIDEYQRTTKQFDDLADFLRHNPMPSTQSLISRVEAKASHARRGASALSSGRLRRWQILAPHLESYENFSPNGIRAFLRDLVI